MISFRITSISILLMIGFRIFQLLARIYYVIVMQKVLDGSLKNKSLQPIVSEYEIEQYFSYIFLITWLVSFLIWFYISYKKAQEHSKQSFFFKPIIALFSFMIPILNLFAPYKIMHEIWIAENSDLSQEQAGKKLINTWWFLSIFLFCFSRYLSYAFSDSKGLSEIIHSEYYFMAYYAISIYYFLSLKKLVTLIKSEQNYRASNVD